MAIGARMVALMQRVSQGRSADRGEATMYRTLIAAIAFVAISLATSSASHAQDFSPLQNFNGQDQFAFQAPAEAAEGQFTGEEQSGDTIQPQERYWVWVNSYCWRQWVFVGYNYRGQAVYRRYVYCR
jgi:hypothetical protein